MALDRLRVAVEDPLIAALERRPDGTDLVAEPVATVDRVLPVARDLLRRFAAPRPVRLLGVRVAGLEPVSPDAAQQLTLAL